MKEKFPQEKGKMIFIDRNLTIMQLFFAFFILLMVTSIQLLES